MSEERRLSVLVVDDDEEDFLLTREALAALPDLAVDAEWAPGYDEALERIGLLRHDVYLVDQRLGHRTGLEWLDEALARGVTAPIIMLTGQVGDALDARAMASGAADFLRKDELDAAHLERTIRYALERSQLRAQVEIGLNQYQALFRNAPIPMWVYDRETLRFLAVNGAAIAKYGYSEAQFLSMTLLDIRPPSDHDLVRASASSLPSGMIRSGPWKHRLASGEMIDALIASHDIRFNGRAARFVVINDISLQLRAERLVRDGARQLRQVLADVGDALLVVGGDGRVRFANAAAGVAWQSAPEHLEGRALPITLDPGQREVTLPRADGTLRHFDVSRAETQWAGEDASVLTLRDITDRRAAEEQLRLLKRAIHAASNGIVISDARRDGIPIIYANPAFEDITGFSLPEVLGQNCSLLRHHPDDQAEHERLYAAIGGGDEYEGLIRFHRKNDAMFWGQLALAPVRDADGSVTHLVGVLSDVTEQRRHEAELAQLANRDPVTGLPLFLALDDHMRSVIAAAAARGGGFAIHSINIDRFNNVNDTLGHAIGDQALRQVAERLHACAGGDVRIARLAGDEFIAIAPRTDDVADALALGERLRACIEPLLTVEPYSLHLTCTVGVALYPAHADSVGGLLNCAEMAMSRGKRRGRNNVTLFESGFANELRDRIALGSRLRDAIDTDELTLHFQPQVSGLDGRIVGMEALVRWRSPDEGLILPSRFIRVAEELGMIVPLGRWVLRAACRQIRAWHAAGHHDIAVSVNVSTHQLLREDFVDDIRDQLERHGVPPNALELEITESALMENVERVIPTLQELRAMGVQLTLDDFGTGYSSLNYLRRLPIGKIKIDRSLLSDIGSGAGDAAIARAVIAMGHQMQLTVLAEGIEREDQLGYLRRNHCDQFQGYLFSQPVDVDAADRLLRQRFLLPEAFEATRPDRVLLLVDDEENVLRSLQRLFRRDGYRVLTATDTREAFALLARNHVQVILSDQRMPGTSGTEFLGVVKDLYPDTVRLVLSGYTDLATVTEAINRGSIYRFLTKPWNEGELREHIREAFRKHEDMASAHAL